MASQYGNDLACFGTDSESVRPQSRSQALLPTDWTGDNPCDHVYPRHMNAINQAIIALKGRTSTQVGASNADLNTIGTDSNANINGTNILYAFEHGQTCANKPTDISDDAFIIFDLYTGASNRTQVLIDTESIKIYFRVATLADNSWTFSDWSEFKSSELEVVEYNLSDASTYPADVINNILQTTSINSAWEISQKYLFVGRESSAKRSLGFITSIDLANSSVYVSNIMNSIVTTTYFGRGTMQSVSYSIPNDSMITRSTKHVKFYDWSTHATGQNSDPRNLGDNELDTINYNAFLLSIYPSTSSDGSTYSTPQDSPSDFFHEYTLNNNTYYEILMPKMSIDLDKLMPFVEYEVQYTQDITPQIYNENSYTPQKVTLSFTNTSGWTEAKPFSKAGWSALSSSAKFINSYQVDNSTVYRTKFVVDNQKHLYWILY